MRALLYLLLASTSLLPSLLKASGEGVRSLGDLNQFYLEIFQKEDSQPVRERLLKELGSGYMELAIYSANEDSLICGGHESPGLSLGQKIALRVIGATHSKWDNKISLKRATLLKSYLDTDPSLFSKTCMTSPFLHTAKYLPEYFSKLVEVAPLTNDNIRSIFGFLHNNIQSENMAHALSVVLGRRPELEKYIQSIPSSFDKNRSPMYTRAQPLVIVSGNQVFSREQKEPWVKTITGITIQALLGSNKAYLKEYLIPELVKSYAGNEGESYLNLLVQGLDVHEKLNQSIEDHFVYYDDELSFGIPR